MFIYVISCKIHFSFATFLVGWTSLSLELQQLMLIEQTLTHTQYAAVLRTMTQEMITD